MSRPSVVLGKTAKSSVPLLQASEAVWLKGCAEQEWDGKSPICTGAYVSSFDGIDFHMCFHKSGSGSRRILVSLTPGAYGNGRNEGPRFSRWKYTDETDSSVLCVDDPMAYLYGIRYGWFGGKAGGGTDGSPMWESLGKLILAVCSASGIEEPDIVFYSSSSGGTASILASSAIGIGCTVVAINPQLCLTLSTRYPGYMRKGYLSPLLKDPDYILDIIKEHKENRYVIMENVASAVDYNRYFIRLCRHLSIDPMYGITHRSNLVTWVYNAPSPEPHKAMDWKTFFPAVEFLVDRLDALDSVPGHMLEMFTALLEEHHAAQRRIAELEAKDPVSGSSVAVNAAPKAKASGRRKRRKKRQKPQAHGPDSGGHHEKIKEN